jgi:general secretion pathway protein D
MVLEANQVRLEIEEEISEAGSPAGALGAIPITKRTANTTVWVDDQQTIVIGGLMRDAERRSRRKVPVLGDLPVLGFLFRHSEVTTEKLNLLLILTPHVVQNQEDLRKIFERKMQERQEFIDRYLVFSGRDWEPPRDWSRTNGLVEDIRQAHFMMDEKLRLEVESAPKAKPEHAPSEPIELPAGVKSGAGGATQAQPQPPATPRPAPRRPRAPTNPNPATTPAPAPGPAPAPAPAQPPRTQNDSPIRINPVARSVNVERVE